MARRQPRNRTPHDRRRRPEGRRRPQFDFPDPNTAFPPAVVVLSGGAPNGALTAGTLAAIYRGGKTFSTLYTSGAGALIGMLFKAPRGNDPSGNPLPPDKALEQLLQFGVEDSIYRMFPVGYKTFFKSGPFTQT